MLLVLPLPAVLLDVVVVALVLVLVVGLGVEEAFNFGQRGSGAAARALEEAAVLVREMPG